MTTPRISLSQQIEAVRFAARLAAHEDDVRAFVAARKGPAA